MDLLVLPIMVSAVGIGLVSLCAMIGMALLSFQRAEFAKNLMNNTIYPLLFGVAACWIGYAVSPGRTGSTVDPARQTFGDPLLGEHPARHRVRPVVGASVLGKLNWRDMPVDPKKIGERQ